MKNDLWDLSFISESNFNKCLLETISTYLKSIQSYTLKKI